MKRVSLIMNANNMHEFNGCEYLLHNLLMIFHMEMADLCNLKMYTNPSTCFGTNKTSQLVF